MSWPSVSFSIYCRTMNPVDTIFTAYVYGGMQTERKMMKAFEQLCYLFSMGYRATLHDVVMEFMYHLVYTYWHRVQHCIKMCQSIGDMLGFYATDHPQLEGLIEELHNWFCELRNHGRIDTDRIDEDVIIKLLGIFDGSEFMCKLHLYPVLPLVQRRTNLRWIFDTRWLQGVTGGLCGIDPIWKFCIFLGNSNLVMNLYDEF